MDRHSERPDNSGKHKKKNRFSWLSIIVLLILLLLVIGGYLVFFSQSYNQEVKNSKIGQTITANTPKESKVKESKVKDSTVEESLKKAINKLLETIQKNEIQAAYDMTSKEFKNATPFEDFRAFIQSLPILAQHKTAAFEGAHMESIYYGKINVTLKDDKTATTFEFILFKEEGKWKIFGVRIIAPEKGESRNVLAEEVKSVITAQLSALHGKDISIAYYAFTSIEFQKSTSLDAFKAMMEKFPALVDDHAISKMGKVEINEPNASVDVSLIQEGDKETRVRYALVREESGWKILSMRPMLAYATPETEFSTAEQEAVTAIVSDQIRDIKAGDTVKAYYAYSSQEFQDSATVEQFTKFISSYPALTKYKNIEFDKGHKEDHLGVIIATLHDDHSETIIEYLLIQENGKWKIFSMEIAAPQSTKKVETPAKEKQAHKFSSHDSSTEIADAMGDSKEDHVPPYFNSEDLQQIIENQLKALRKQDLSKAYYGYTSKEFQEYTPYKDFEQFVKNHPFLFQNAYFQTSKFNIEDDVGTFDGSLVNANKDHQEVQFRLIFQDGKWKILTIELKPIPDSSTETSQSDSKPLTIPQIIIGTKIDSNGIVTNGIVAEPSSVLSVINETLYVNIYVANAPAGTDLSLVMEHVNSGSKIPAVSMKIEQNIETATLAFSFTPPAHGWPKGKYKLHIDTSTGVQKDFPFTIK